MEAIIITFILAVAGVQVSKFYFAYKTYKLDIEAEKHHGGCKAENADREE